MREFEFRGLNEDKEWIYGSLLEIGEEKFIHDKHYIDLEDIDVGGAFQKVTDVGLKSPYIDKNSTALYQGDILMCTGLADERMDSDEDLADAFEERKLMFTDGMFHLGYSSQWKDGYDHWRSVEHNDFYSYLLVGNESDVK